MAASAAAFLLGVGPTVSAVAAATPTTIAPTTITPITIAPITITPTTIAPIADAARTTTKVTVVPTRADQVIAIAKSKLGHPWVFGATGPSVFDCSGLVIYSFRTAGISRVVGSSREVSAFALYARFRALGLASTTGGRPGDLVIWGGGTHVGIYLGNGMAISTLVSGVRVHAVRALTTPFTAFLHTGIAATAAAAVPHATKPNAVASTGVKVTSHRITTTGLRLRAGPSTAARVLGTLAPGTKVGVVRSAKDGSGRTWLRVLVGGRLGWVAGWHTRAA
jgi:peptidoglycan DL-endopeptidase CwlO